MLRSENLRMARLTIPSDAESGSPQNGITSPSFTYGGQRTPRSNSIPATPGTPCTTMTTTTAMSFDEKHELRIDGDELDHTQYKTKSVGFIMTVVGCSFALAGSQISSLLYITVGTDIATQLHAVDITIWLLSAGIVAQGAMAPFVGPLADLYGRKMMFVAGLVCSVVGSIVCAATPTAGGFIAGQVLLGFGSVVQELMSISVVAEIVPTAKRTLYAALILCSIIPWAPGSLYSNYLASASWRWIGLPLALWNAITLALIAFFYFPPPRVNARGLSQRDKLARIDWVGGILLTAGLVLFLYGLNSGGQQYAWSSPHILTFLLVGVGLIITFGIWEFFGTTYPLFPRRIVHAPRPFFCMLFVIFAAGINYIPLVVFWPIQTIAVYGSNREMNGVNTLPIGIAILVGAIISALLIGIFPRYTTWQMTFFCAMQASATACLVIVDPHDIRIAFVPLVLALIGVGGVLVPNQIIVTMITPDDLIASVTALTVGLRSQAQVVGLAIYYNRFLDSVLKNAFKYVVPPILGAGVFNVTAITDLVTGLSSAPYAQLAQSIPQLVSNQTSFNLVREGTIQCFSESFKTVYFISIAFGVSACIAAAAMGDVHKYMDNHVAVVL